MLGVIELMLGRVGGPSLKKIMTNIAEPAAIIASTNKSTKN